MYSLDVKPRISEQIQSKHETCAGEGGLYTDAGQNSRISAWIVGSRSTFHPGRSARRISQDDQSMIQHIFKSLDIHTESSPARLNFSKTLSKSQHCDQEFDWVAKALFQQCDRNQVVEGGVTISDDDDQQQTRITAILTCVICLLPLKSGVSMLTSS